MTDTPRAATLRQMLTESQLQIPSLRLRAMPPAVRCQPCAARRERRPAVNAAPSRWGLLADVAVAGPA